MALLPTNFNLRGIKMIAIIRLIRQFILVTLLPLIRCFFILFIILKTSEEITKYLPIQLPASIIGMAILFFLIALDIIPMLWMRFGCQLIIKYMAIFFIPATMGIMDTYEALLNDWIPILGGTFFSTLTVFITISLLTEKLINKKNNESQED